MSHQLPDDRIFIPAHRSISEDASARLNAELLCNLAVEAVAAAETDPEEAQTPFEHMVEVFRFCMRHKIGPAVLSSIMAMDLDEDDPRLSATLRRAVEIACSTPYVALSDEPEQGAPVESIRAHTFVMAVGIFHDEGLHDPRQAIDQHEEFLKVAALLRPAISPEKQCNITLLPYLYSHEELSHFHLPALHDLPEKCMRHIRQAYTLQPEDLMQVGDGLELQRATAGYQGPMVRFLVGVLWSNDDQVTAAMRHLWPEGVPEGLFEDLCEALAGACSDKAWSIRPLNIDLFFDALRDGVRRQREMEFVAALATLLDDTGIAANECYFRVVAPGGKSNDPYPVLHVIGPWLEHLGEVIWPYVTFDQPTDQLIDLHRTAVSMGMRWRDEVFVAPDTGRA